MIDTYGLDLDNVVGHAMFKNTLIKLKDRELWVDSVQVSSSISGNKRTFLWNSERFNLSMQGTFQFATIIKDFKRLVHEYKLNLENNKSEIAAYYRDYQQNDLQKYNIDFRAYLIDINPLLNLTTSGLYISPGAIIEGEIRGGYTTILMVNTVIDSLKYKNYNFYNNKIDISTSKIADSTNVLATVIIESEYQKFGERSNTDNLYIEVIWDKDSIVFETYLEQKQTGNFAQLKGRFNFRENQTDLRFEPSRFKVLERHWEFSPTNIVTFANSEIIVNNLVLFNEGQSIALNGTLSPDSTKRLDIKISQFQLNNLNPLINQDLKGEINGKISVQNIYKNLVIESSIEVSDFKISNFLVGDVSGLSEWDNSNKWLNVHFDIDRGQKNIIHLSGQISPQKPTDQLNLTAKFDEANLNIIEPFVKKRFTEIGGLASGIFKIGGNINSPILTGNGYLKEGEFKVNYLNTTYQFEGEVYFEPNEIIVKDLKLHDPLKNEAIINGGVFHDGFLNPIIDLRADLNNFMVLNTSSLDNQLYYGSGFITGEVNFFGPFSNLSINANAITNRGTKIYIPIGGSSSFEEKEFINFVDLRETTTKVLIKKQQRNINLKGLNLDFDLEITPDAYAEIIFDIKAGDIIRGNGNGKLKLQIDTKGDFNMFGDFEMQKGGYNFTLYNIINKEFEIQPKSKISWYGDPYEGILNITAHYKQLASLAPLVQDTALQNLPEIRRKYPSRVELDLQGRLLSPSIAFDIEVEEFPDIVITNSGSTVDLKTIYQAFKNDLYANEQELNRQVFSLIILRKFSPKNSFAVTGGETLGNSVSELISNQLSYWITQVDENLEIDVDLGNLDDNAFNTFQLRLSYTFLDGRLRVTRDGGFTNTYNQSDVSSIAGDWTLEYLLTPDGKFKVKMYNKNNYNKNTAGIDNPSTTAGFSVIYTKSFNELRELLAESRDKQIRQQTLPPEPPDPQDSRKKKDENKKEPKG